jgi:O-acetyl-ADP-ribose deacetylase (regulator of RNase III)
MSKALLKSSVKPKLLHRFAAPATTTKNRAIEVWTTTCIVTNFHQNDDPQHDKPSVLINPSNPQLTGVKNFPYFPKGGPVPKEKPMSMHKDWQPLGFVSQWGGMEVGTGMLFPVSVVDGLVHTYGGWKLQAECKLKQSMAATFGSNQGEACPIGDAVVTSAGNDQLSEYYDWIVHTTPPFYNFHDTPEEALLSCYRSALALAFTKGDRVATTLVGSGARGFPTEQAIEVAAKATKEWCDDDDAASPSEQVLLFGLLEETHAEELIKTLQKL